MTIPTIIMIISIILGVGTFALLFKMKAIRDKQIIRDRELNGPPEFDPMGRNKTMRAINIALTKYPVPIMVIVITILEFILVATDSVAGVQSSVGLGFLMVIFISWMMFFGNVNRDFVLVTKDDRERTVLKRLNNYTALVVFVFSIWLITDIQSKDSNYYEVANCSVEETRSIYTVDVDGLDYSLYVNKDDITVDDNNPLKIYHAMKVDRFGHLDVDEHVVKSDLMTEYVKLKRIR